MPWMGFEPTISAGERPQTYALDRAATGTGFFVNRTIKNWNQLPAEVLGTFPFKPKIFRNRVRKAVINVVKRKE